jgi:hypothetical protein
MKHNLSVKTSLALVAGLLCLQTPASAAEQPDAAQRSAAVRERMQQVARELNLTDEQKEKLKPIFQAQMEKARELRENQHQSRREKLKKFKAMQKEMEAKLKPVLSDEQFQKWQKQRQEMREQIGQRRQGRSEGGPLQR